MQLTRALPCAVLALTTFFAVGCGQGSDSSDETVDIAALQPGNYRTTPRTPDEVRTPETIDIQEALRLAESVPLAIETDPRLVFNRVADQRKMFTQLEPPRMIDNFSTEIPGFVVGWETTGQRRENQNFGRSVEVTVLRFSESAQAAHAAKVLSDRAWAGAYPPVRTIPIPRYGNAVGQVGQYDSVTTWVAHDTFMVKTYVGPGVDIPPDPEELAEFTGTLLDTQFEGLRSYKPTPVDELADLPVDPEGILAYALHSQENVPEAVLSHKAALHLMYRPDSAKRAFEDAQVDRAVFAENRIFRAGDTAAAERLQAYFISRLDSSLQPIDPPPGMSTAHCVEAPETTGSLACLFTNGRYSVVMDGFNQIQELHQKASAQYLLLEKAPQ